jgi:hypothetical protein
MNTEFSLGDLSPLVVCGEGSGGGAASGRKPGDSLCGAREEGQQRDSRGWLDYTCRLLRAVFASHLLQITKAFLASFCDEDALRPPNTMAHLRRLAPQLVSPTPIRPHSPAGSPSRFALPPDAFILLVLCGAHRQYGPLGGTDG